MPKSTLKERIIDGEKWRLRSLYGYYRIYYMVACLGMDDRYTTILDSCQPFQRIPSRKEREEIEAENRKKGLTTVWFKPRGIQAVMAKMTCK